MNSEHADLEARFAAPAERDLPPGRHNQHREVLMNHMLTTSGEVEPAPGRHRHRRRILAFGGAAGIAIGAAAVTVTMIATSAPPSRPPAGGHSTSSAVTSPLVRLAGYITTSARKQPGDATLVVRTSTYTTGEPSGTSADLYTDSGAYYWAPTESGLPAQIAAHHNLGDGMFAREVSAAVFAAHNGNLATARERMANAPAAPGSGGSGGSGGSEPVKMSPAAAALRAKLLGIKPVPGQSLAAAVNEALFNNNVWGNSLDALVAGSGNPEVRAGVLRLLSTVPGITVTNAAAGGQSALVVEYMSPLGRGPYREALTLNARTGIPIEYTAGAVGKTPDVTVSYKVSRVTVAAIAAGKF
jgi:hypothetical protein